jgi:SH3 domain-containing YSC84-like protein 1
MNRISSMIVAFFMMASAALPAYAADKKKEEGRLNNAGQVMREILNMPDTMPQSALDMSKCVVVIPSVLKAAFIVGGSYGRGAMVCRTGKNFTGPWGAPSMYAIEGASFGLQLGGQATDFVFYPRQDAMTRTARCAFVPAILANLGLAASCHHALRLQASRRGC